MKTQDQADFRSIAIDELVTAAKAGCQVARAQLFWQFQPLLKSVAGKYRTLSYDDAYQEACLALFRCVEAFDSRAGVPFTGFAARMVHGSVRTAMRREWRSQERCVHPVESGERDTGMPQWDHKQTVSFNDALHEVELRLFFQQAGLSAREVLAMEKWLWGWRCQEVATGCGVSVETVKTWRKRALKKLRAASRHVDLP